eukprot:6933537-Pyramimonas_sp.AAC.3
MVLPDAIAVKESEPKVPTKLVEDPEADAVPEPQSHPLGQEGVSKVKVLPVHLKEYSSEHIVLHPPCAQIGVSMEVLLILPVDVVPVEEGVEEGGVEEGGVEEVPGAQRTVPVRQVHVAAPLTLRYEPEPPHVVAQLPLLMPSEEHVAPWAGAAKSATAASTHIATDSLNIIMSENDVGTESRTWWTPGVTAPPSRDT